MTDRQPRWMVLLISWTEILPGVYTEVYGPWQVRDDDGHHDDIASFFRDWHAQSADREMLSAQMFLVTPPGQNPVSALAAEHRETLVAQGWTPPELTE